MYVNKGGHLVQNGTLAEVDLSSTGVAGGNWICVSRCQISQLVGVITTVFSSTGAASVQFLARPTYGSSSGQITIGTLTLGTSGGVAAVGGAWIQAISPVTILPGYQVVTNVATAVTTSGKAIFGFEVIDSPERLTDLSTYHAG